MVQFCSIITIIYLYILSTICIYTNGFYLQKDKNTLNNLNRHNDLDYQMRRRFKNNRHTYFTDNELKLDSHCPQKCLIAPCYNECIKMCKFNDNRITHW